MSKSPNNETQLLNTSQTESSPIVHCKFILSLVTQNIKQHVCIKSKNKLLKTNDEDASYLVDMLRFASTCRQEGEIA